MKWSESIKLNMRMLKHLFKASPGYCIVNAVNTVCNSVFLIIRTLFYKYIIDVVVYSKESIEYVIVSFLIYYLLMTVSYSIDFGIRSNFNEKQKIKIAQYYKNLICGESVKKSISNFSDREYADRLHNAAYSDGEHLYNFAGIIFDFVNGIVNFIFFCGLFIQLHPVFVLVAFLTAVKNIICATKTNKAQYQMYQTNLKFERHDRYLYNLFYLKQYAQEMRMYPIAEHFADKFKSLKELDWKNKKKSQYQINCINTISAITDLFFYLLSMIILVYFMITQKVTVGEFSIVITSLTLAAGNIQRVLMFIPNINNEARYIKDIFSVIDAEDYVYPEVRHTDGQEEVVFKNVSFSYDGENPVLKDINLELPLSGKTAIVGKNGSGKSTFIKLLLGLYKPTGGEIEYLYHCTHTCDTLRLFSTLLQDYKVFALTIADNIRKKEAGEEEHAYTSGIRAALQFGGLLEKVESLPNGIHTVLSGEFSEDGICLSGGEQQRLAIARAYAGNNPILVLDEPSGNLDPIAEKELINKINKLAADKAAILVTHDLAYTQNVDLVLVFDNGSIVEYGSPEELLREKGHYYRMMSERSHLEGVITLSKREVY